MATTPFQDLGVGVGLRAPYLSRFISKKSTQDLKKIVQWVEAVTENYLPYRELKIEHAETRALQNLLKVREQFPVALHGVSLNLGDAGGNETLFTQYLPLLKNLVNQVEPIVVSDHLCWTGTNGHSSHDLLPLPYTLEAVELVVERIKRVQDYLGRQILIENLSSYVTFKHSEMSEQEFVTEIITRADCGLLLDVNNVYVSAINHSFDPLEYIAALPKERIGQIHLAGHRTKEDGSLIDTHDEPVCQGVWDLYAQTLSIVGQKSTMIERDDNFCEWDELALELQAIHRIRQEHQIAMDRTTPTVTTKTPLNLGQVSDRGDTNHV